MSDSAMTSASDDNGPTPAGEWQLDVPEVFDAPIETAAAPHAAPAPVRPPAPTPPPVLRIVEAMLFASTVPLTYERVAESIRGVTAAQLVESVDELNRAYRSQGRPYGIMKQEQGYVLSLRPTYRHVLGKIYGSTREARLSPVAVEVLAVVAYKQPITRRELDTIRGHDSGSLLRQLVRRGLVQVIARAEGGGSEVQYGTTPRFLELFGLSSLEELPETEDLQRL